MRFSRRVAILSCRAGPDVGADRPELVHTMGGPNDDTVNAGKVVELDDHSMATLVD
jgi:hypothetical protein